MNAASSPTSPHPEFRPDIQILRGFAIAGVFGFHLRPDWIQAGFLGVDVFFVISGYLMHVVYRGGANGSVRDFWFRRARRILPAYFAVLLIGLALAAFLLLPHEFGDFARHSLYSIFLAPNVGYWMDNSYFYKDELKPFLHFWSLGVELQFYLLFPAIVWLHRRSKLLAVALALSSMAACFLMTGISPKTSFFWMPLRIWEFMFGFYAAQLAQPSNADIRSPHRSYMGLLCLVLIAFCLFQSTSESDHPKYLALATSFATAGLLVLGMPKTLVEGVFGRAMATLGNYSYSVYLVHFPIIIFWFYEPFRGNEFPPAGWLDSVAVIAITAGCAWLLFNFVERPARRIVDLKRYARLQSPFIAVALLGAVAAPMLQRSAFDPALLPGLDAWYDRGVYRCGKTSRLLDPASQSCSLTHAVKGERQVLLVGNSYMDSIKDAMIEVAVSHGAGVRLMTANCSLGQPAGCALPMIEREIRMRGIDTVILHTSAAGVDVEAVRQLIQIGERENFSVVMIDPTPIWPRSVPALLYASARRQLPQGLPRQTLADHLAANAPLEARLAALDGAHFRRFDPAEILCDPDCRIADAAGRPFYFDNAHMTITGARQLAPIYEAIFSPGPSGLGVKRQQNDGGAGR